MIVLFQVVMDLISPRPDEWLHLYPKIIDAFQDFTQGRPTIIKMNSCPIP